MATRTKVDIPQTASELRFVLGQLLRRLRAEHRFPIHHGAVLGRLEDLPHVSVLVGAQRPGRITQKMAA